MNTKRVGQILKEAREEKKLTIKDVSKETNIAAKYIIALETEDYSQFPAETFALGFLKNYASYLKLDTGLLLNLYRGEQIEESQAPLEELTKPTSSGFPVIQGNLLLSILTVFLIGGAIFLLYISFQESNQMTTVEEETEEVDLGSQIEIPSNLVFKNQSVPENKTIPFILLEKEGVSFSVNNQQCRIFIKKSENGRATLGFNIAPDRSVYFFDVSTGEEKVLSSTEPELANLRRDIKIQTEAVRDKSARVTVTLGMEREGVDTRPMGNVPIQVTLFFTKPSYVEFVIDGQKGQSGTVSQGQTKTLEAQDRLEIKIGDGSAVEMIQNGKERVVFGKTPGKQVKKVFVRTQNPYDSTQSIIKELAE